jgi:hypothetical protein
MRLKLDQKTTRLNETDAILLVEDEVLPGPYNLLEDALLHSNALDRPTKDCTLGI